MRRSSWANGQVNAISRLVTDSRLVVAGSQFLRVRGRARPLSPARDTEGHRRDAEPVTAINVLGTDPKLDVAVTLRGSAIVLLQSRFHWSCSRFQVRADPCVVDEQSHAITAVEIKKSTDTAELLNARQHLERKGQLLSDILK